MYNIIQSKYRYIFLICILGVLVSLFINSTKIVEGAQNKKKKQANNVFETIFSDLSDDKKEDLSKSDTKTTKMIKSEVKAALPSLVKDILQKPIAEMKDTQLKTKKILDTVNLRQNTIDESITKANSNMKTAVQINNYKLMKKQKELLSNLSQQYDMYKTGLSNEVDVATKDVKELNQNISKASDAAVESSNEAKKYAELSNKVYNDVFGAISTRVIQQDIAEPFTQMSSSGYTQELFDLEKELVNAINDFNTTYYNFVRCSSGGSNCNVGTPILEKDVIAKSNVVNEKAKALELAYTSAKIQTSDDGTFEIKHKEIMEKAKSVDELRRTLDTRMDAVLKTKNPPNELTKQYDSTVYTGIMWSVLATSVLFYIFTEF